MTDLFDTKKNELLLIFDVQAHSVRDGGVGGSEDLVQGGQLLFMSKEMKKAKKKKKGKKGKGKK